MEYSYRYIIPIKWSHSWSLTFTIPAIFNRTDPSNSIQECCWVWVQQGLVPFHVDVTFYKTFVKINININKYILNLNLYLSIENQAIKWWLFLFLGCRKFGAPLWRSSHKISHRGILQDLLAYLGVIRLIGNKYDESSLVVLSVGQIMTYFMFPECDQILLRGTKNPFKFAPQLTCGVTALLVVPGVHYLERSTALYFCHSVFTNNTILSLNLTRVRTPPEREPIDQSKLAPDEFLIYSSILSRMWLRNIK